MIHSRTEGPMPASVVDVAIGRLVPQAQFRGPRTYIFDRFLFQPERQLLVYDETQVRIGGRAFDILAVLVERPGELVSKQDLLSRVWPHVFIEEANLKANVAILRRALNERHAAPRFIATIVGRGYRFICPVQSVGGSDQRSI
jgi:DNA-binding winged helix-turn-helix (wHTH) protein